MCELYKAKLEHHQMSIYIGTWLVQMWVIFLKLIQFVCLLPEIRNNYR